MGGIKYYQLVKGEEMPDEFCVVRDVDGEPSEYMFYVPEAESAKLRDALKSLMMGTNAELCAGRDESNCKECSMHHGKDGCTVVDAMELLGIDMYGEPLEVKL